MQIADIQKKSFFNVNFNIHPIFNTFVLQFIEWNFQ